MTGPVSAVPAQELLRSTDVVPTPGRYDWSRLDKLQVGRYGEYLAKMEFTLLGFDVYGTEVDNKGTDFVIRRGADRFHDIQVKAVTCRSSTDSGSSSRPVCL